MGSKARKRFALLGLLLAFVLVAAACGDDDEGGGDGVKACLVTDLAGIDDRSFNASAWDGVNQAQDEGFARDIQVLESDTADDWQPNIDQFVDQGCEHIVTVGFTATNAQAHTDITWTIVDFDFFDFPEDAAPVDVSYPNVKETVFQTDEAAFVAGYLAAGVSTTKVLGTYGGANFPTVSIFMDGFTRGAQHYADVKGVDITVRGWDPDAGDGIFTGSFTDMALAGQTAESLFDEGVDVILPVGGAINLPAGDVIIDRGLGAALVGVDVDAFNAAPAQYQDLWLTTVEKGLQKAVFESIRDHANGTWTNAKSVGNLANDGVGIAPYHSWDDRVPADLKAEVDQLIADIKDGTINAAFTPVG
jgi:basic membrane protein A